MQQTVKGVGGIEAKIIADSISAAGHRITTMQLKYPRFIHSEFMTHRVFSRNAASSRAIPVAKMLEQVTNDPAMPIHWGANQRGMQAGGEVEDIEGAKQTWRDIALLVSTVVEEWSEEQGLHKQILNRLLEPFQFMHTVVTATEWDNFFALRIHKDAQPEIQELAMCMYEAMANSKPEVLGFGQWHLPYVKKGEFTNGLDISNRIKCSAARCARVSYLNHDKSEPSIVQDLKLYSMLAVRPYDDGSGHVLGEGDPVHLSPLEHQAQPMSEDGWSGNFHNWTQYRQTI